MISTQIYFEKALKTHGSYFLIAVAYMSCASIMDDFNDLCFTVRLPEFY